MTSLSEIFETEQPVALVTGSGVPRVGQAVASRLHGLGCRIVLHAHQSIEEARQTAGQWSDSGPDTIAISADLSKPSEVDQMVTTVTERWKRIDILIHAAAIWWPKSLEATTEDDLDTFYQVNQKATFLVAQKIGLQMAAQSSGGTIVLMGDWAYERPYLNYSAYFMAKGSIPVLTRVFATELAQRNPKIRVNAVLPGPVTLPDSLSPSQYQHALNGTLRKTEGRAEDVAQAAVSLVMNQFVTGVCLPVDGGRSIYSPNDDYKTRD